MSPSISPCTTLAFLCDLLCHWCYFYWFSHMIVSDFIFLRDSTHPSLHPHLSLWLHTSIAASSSFSVIPHIHRCILISFTSSLFSWLFVVDHVPMDRYGNMCLLLHDYFLLGFCFSWTTIIKLFLLLWGLIIINYFKSEVTYITNLSQFSYQIWERWKGAIHVLRNAVGVAGGR